MITPEARLMVLYDVEKRIMDQTTKTDREYDTGWKVVQRMIEEEYKHRDAMNGVK